MGGYRLFEEVSAVGFGSVVPYSAGRYRRLLSTFSNHRMLPVRQRVALLDALAEVARSRGGVVGTRSLVELALGAAGRVSWCRGVSVDVVVLTW